MNDFYVYEWIRLDTNEPFYIGKGRGQRARSTSNRTNHFKNIVKKHGAAVIILHAGLTDEEACQIECWYIWQLRDIQGYNLINLTDGGDGIAGYKYTEEQRLRQSISQRLAQNRPEVREKHSQSSRGCKNGFYNKKHTEEFKKKTSERMKGHTIMTGRILSESWKKSISLATSGDNNPRAIKIKIVFPNKDEEIFGSYVVAAKELKIDARQLRKLAKTNQAYIPAKNVMKKYGHLEGIVVHLES